MGPPGEPGHGFSTKLNETPAGKSPREPTHELPEVLIGEDDECSAANVENLLRDATTENPQENNQLLKVGRRLAGYLCLTNTKWATHGKSS